MLNIQFIINERFQYQVYKLGFPAALLLEFIIQNSSNGNEYIKLSAKEIEDHFWCLSESTIYRSLKFLEKKSYIKSIANEKDNFDRIKSYTLESESLLFLNESFNYSYNDKEVLGDVYRNFNDYKNNVKYSGLTKEQYIKFLIEENIEFEKNCPF